MKDKQSTKTSKILINEQRKDPYKRTKEDVREPPQGWRASIRHIGPSIILAGTIVGMGELVATTILGAKIGFACLWIVIVSCLIKLIVQSELGRYTISSGETTLAAFNKVPGPRYRASWFVWFWIIMEFITVAFCGAGLIGSLGEVMHLMFPQLSVFVGALIMSAVIFLILIPAKYDLFEKFTISIVCVFTLITIFCVVLLQWTPYTISLADISFGLSGHLPPEAFFVALGVFGATGIGTHELVFYPYWCVEKGYARYVGPPDNTQSWERRAKGWISVMHKDIVIGAVLFTITTSAFYILGAAVLHGMEIIPTGMALVDNLSYMYTETLGSWAFYLFLVGAFFVLLTTGFVCTASHSRAITNCMEVLRLIKIDTFKARRLWINIWIVIQLILLNVTFFVFKVPDMLYITGAALLAIMLPFIAFSTIYMRYKHLDKRLAPSKMSDFILWLCSIVITTITAGIVYLQILG